MRRGSPARVLRRARLVDLRRRGARRRRARARRPRRPRDPERRRRAATVGEPEEPPHVLYAGPALGGEGRPRARRGGARPAARRRRRRAAPRPGAARRSASSRTTSCSGSTSAPRSSPARRCARASASSAPEAMAHGRPVVASRSAGSATSSSTARPGCSSRRGDVAALRAGARAAARATPSCARRLGDGGAGAGARRTSRGTARSSLTRHRLRGRLPAGRSARLRPREPRELTIDGVRIADDTDCWVIAEIGHNHQGSLEHVQAALRRGRRAAARTRSSSRSATTARSTRARSSTGPYENENSYGPTYGAAPRGARVRPRASTRS